MKRFAHMCFCASLVAALAPVALSAQTITFAQPHAVYSGAPSESAVTVYAYGNYLGKSINHLIVRYPSSQNGQTEYSYEFLVGDGSGDFPEYSQLTLPTESAALTADINGDGYPDLITLLPACIAAPCLNTADPEQGNVTFMVNNGNESFSNVGSMLLPVGLSGLQGVVGDFNKDGKPDVAIIAYATGGTFVTARLIVLLNQGDESFSMKSYLLPSALSSGAAVSNIVTGDFNGDGMPDLAVAFASPTTGDNAWLLTFAGDGKGNFAPAKKSYIFDSNFVANGHPLQAADLNGDGRTDLVINLQAKSDAGQPRIASLLSKGSADFYWASAVSIAAPGATDIVVADFNGDGKPDLAYIGETEYPQPIIEVGGVYPGNGKGGFSTPHIPLFPSTTSGGEVVQGSPTATLTAMPFHSGLLPSLLVSLASPTFNANYFYELINTSK